ncbi:MAG: UDP-N-acetylmuramoyl-tripeptide--D-alanyl-D-alanine ligase, partial [Pseudomonadota bacterium]|nr:UDP-N-acetylmuramoyl-tripeptide--D-alanyl-D-alanine ligase [Pseudomonadota bacterium]
MADRELYSSAEVVAATGGRLDGRPPSSLGGVSIDSRAIAAGDIFVAIKGDRLDGHEFAAAALAAGAGLAIVSRPTPAMREQGALLIVTDPLEALRQLARRARARSGATIIAVTGSVGKTGTKEALRLALTGEGPTHASASSFNNHWGVPLSLARMAQDARFGIFEIGMNHAGEITPLVAMVRPHIAIITAIAESHLGHFKSVDDIALAKSEIFSGVEAPGAAIINRDSPHYDRLAAAARSHGVRDIHGFGRHPSADIRLIGASLGQGSSSVTAAILGEAVAYTLGQPGEHIVMNSLAVLGAAKLAGADTARAAGALAGLSPPKGRGVRYRLAAPSGHLVLIDESYNANPASMRAALAVLAGNQPGRGGRRLAVLGDMLELGEHGDG